MHTGKYEKLRFRNICRVYEAAGWAAECPGPRSSPMTAEWRVMRILYPSVSRHSPSSPPTFFILSSHHTNSYGHKMEGEGASEVKWEWESSTHAAPLACCVWLSPSARHDWQSHWHNSPSPLTRFIVHPILNQHPRHHCQLLPLTHTRSLSSGPQLSYC